MRIAEERAHVTIQPRFGIRWKYRKETKGIGKYRPPRRIGNCLRAREYICIDIVKPLMFLCIDTYI